MRPNPRRLLAPAALILVALFALPVGSAGAGRPAAPERCQARDVSTPASFAGCNAREDGRTTTVLSAVGGCVAAGAVLADTDACQSAIEDLIGPCGTFFTTWGSGGSGPGQFNFPLSVAV